MNTSFLGWDIPPRVLQAAEPSDHSCQGTWWQWLKPGHLLDPQQERKQGLDSGSSREWSAGLAGAPGPLSIPEAGGQMWARYVTVGE